MPPERGAFHAGERALQARLGLAERMAEAGARAIRDHLPRQHRDFFAQLPFIVVGSLDARGRPWASALAAPPGFVRAPDERILHIGTLPPPADPLAA
ncbi:MAG: flavin-nucleotide-binding protein, partial [Xenophilus sp.]